MASGSQHRYRTVWISDIHLGTRGCQAEPLLDFLRSVECDTLYLVGDVIDFWRMRRARYWPQSHNDVVQKLLRKARKGTRVILTPGNHDDMLRGYVDHEFGRILVVGDAIHETADGRRLLVIHGDQFDSIVRYARWLAILGDLGIRHGAAHQQWLNWARRKLGLPYWSLSAYLKHKVKNAVQFIDNYETRWSSEARRRGVDGVVCGHIHYPQHKLLDGILYYNDGDWAITAQPWWSMNRASWNCCAGPKRLKRSDRRPR